MEQSKINKRRKRRMSLKNYSGFAFFKEHMTKKTWLGRVTYVFIGALLLTFSFDYFIHPTGAINGGLSGFCQVLANLISSDPVNQLNFYWILYFSLNVPLIIFGFIKIGKQFTILSIILIVSQNIFHFIIINIPHMSSFIVMKDVYNSNLYLWEFLVTIFGGIIYGAGIAFAFLGGGSSGGTDYITTFVSVKKGKPIGHVMKYINLGILLFAVMINKVIIGHDNLFDAIFKETLVFLSIILVIVVTMSVDRWYPRYRKVTLKITTKKSDLLIRSLILKGYPHGFTNIDITGGYSRKSAKLVVTTLTLMEYKSILGHIRRVDPDSFITVENARETIGRYRMPKV